MTLTPSYRAAGLPPEMRDGRRLCCYFAVFDSTTDRVLTEHGRRFREVVRRGAFARTLAADAPVYACVEHDRAATFATRPGSLLLQEDERGLFGSVYLGASPLEERVLAAVAGGELAGCSFGFHDRTVRTTPGTDGVPLDELLSVDLFDVTLTRRGVYRQADVSVRATAGPPAGDDPLALRLRILKCRR